MKAYVVHYKKLVDRRAAMERQLGREGIEADFIDQFDRDTVRGEDLSLFDRRRMPWRFRRRMPDVQVAITLSHLHCLRQIANSGHWGLILEDDAILAPGFRTGLERCVDQLPAGWGMCFLGDGCGFHIPPDRLRDGIVVYPKEREPTAWGGDGATRCTDSYVVHPACAARVIALLRALPRRIDRPIDWWLNEVIRHLRIDVYWAEPTLVTQGSQVAGGTSSY
jgi:GR25 family glycosyltransferase involved in LPS biosynthesis